VPGFFKRLFSSRDKRSTDQDPLYSAIPGTFDASVFINPKTGKFQFPKYKHDPQFIVKIIDSTNYKEEYDWEDLDAREKREFGLTDFEFGFVSSDIEVEPISILFSKKNRAHLEPLGYLVEHWGVVEKLISPLDDEQDWFIADTPVLKRLVEDGYLLTWEPVTPEQRTLYLDTFPIPRLKEVCKKAGLKVARRKQELIEELLAVDTPLDLPPAAVQGPLFYEWVEGLLDLYVTDIKRNADRFHPLYLPDVWEMAVENAEEIEPLRKRIMQVIDTKYWTRKLRPIR